MVIERTEKEVLLRLPSNFDPEILQKIIDFIKFKEAIATSQATENEINNLANESKKNWWQKKLQADSKLVSQKFHAGVKPI